MGGDVDHAGPRRPPRRLAENGNFPSWSPDGRFVYYSTSPWFRSEIQRVPSTGGPAETIPIRLQGGASAFLLSPRVSPDGQWLLFWIPDAIYVTPILGGEARPLVPGRQAISLHGRSLPDLFRRTTRQEPLAVACAVRHARRDARRGSPLDVRHRRDDVLRAVADGRSWRSSRSSGASTWRRRRSTPTGRGRRARPSRSPRAAITCVSSDHRPTGASSCTKTNVAPKSTCGASSQAARARSS